MIGKGLIISLAVLAAAAVAHADAFLGYDAEYNFDGSGLNRFSFYVYADDGLEASYFVEMLYCPWWYGAGTLNNLQFLGSEVMVESLATK